MKYLTLLLLCLLPVASLAQTAELSFTRPTQYTDGTALPAAAITGYDVQCSGWTPTGGTRTTCTQFAPAVLGAAATGGTLTGTIPATGGTACLQVRTKTAPINGAWSTEGCKTFPPLVPNPPGNVTVAIVIGINMAPVYKLTSTGKRSPDPAGYVAIPEECTGNVLFRFRGVNYRKVDASKVQWYGVVPSDNISAACT